MALLRLARLAKRDGAALAGIELVGHRLDRTALPRRVAPLEQDEDALARCSGPARHGDQLGLHRLEQFLVALSLQLLHPHQLSFDPR